MTVTPAALAQLTVNGGKNTSNFTMAVALTSTTSLVYLSGMFKVMTINPDNTVTYGAGTSVTGASTGLNQLLALTPTSVIYTFQDTSNSSYGTAMIATISGVGAAATVSFGSKYVFSSAGTTVCGAVMLSSTSVYIPYGLTAAESSIMATITGTTIAFGTAVQITANAIWNQGYPCACALDSTHVYVTWSNSANTYGVAATITGTVIAYGSNVWLTPYTNSSPISCIALTSTTSLMIGGTTVVIATISGGTTVTFGGVFTSPVSAYSNNFALIKLTSTSFAIEGTTTAPLLVAGTVSGSAVTFGNVYTGFGTYGGVPTWGSVVLSATQILLSYNYSQTPSTFIVNISGQVCTSAYPITQVLTGTADHTEISSIYCFNNSQNTIAVDFVIGTTYIDSAVVARVPVSAWSSATLNLANCPIIIGAGVVLSAFSNNTSPVNITCFGLNCS